MNKLSALLVIAYCLIPTQAGAVITQCHKSACPPIKRSSDAVKQTPAPNTSPTVTPSKKRGL
jgi:hypothetical protein